MGKGKRPRIIGLPILWERKTGHISHKNAETKSKTNLQEKEERGE